MLIYGGLFLPPLPPAASYLPCLVVLLPSLLFPQLLSACASKDLQSSLLPPSTWPAASYCTCF